MSRNKEMRRSMLEELLAGQPALKKQKTPTAPASALMIDGSRAYEERRYADAARLFSHAIENTLDRKADLLHVYDLRSSANVNLHKYEEALKDAKQMIRLDKADHRGYLKCAQIEQLRAKNEEALRICDYGLKHVASTSTGYQRLKKFKLRASEQLNKKIIYEKGTDPMTVLPNELLELVLSFFDYREHIGLMRVCKTWRDRMRSSDLVAKTVDTRYSRRMLTYEQIKAAFARLGQKPRFLALKNLNEPASRSAASELGRWIRWECLETLVLDEPKIQAPRIRWDKLGQLRNIRIGYFLDVRQDQLHILGACGNLRSASLFVHPITPLFEDASIANRNLRDLMIHGKVDKVTLVELQGGCLFPALERLELAHVSSNNDVNLTAYSKLRELCLLHCRFHANLRTPPGLEVFTLCGNFANTYPCPEEIKMPAGNLHTVHVEGSESIKFLAYARRQGLSSEKLRKMYIADFVTFNHSAGRLVRGDLAMLYTYANSGVFDQVQDLVLRDDNLTDDDCAVTHRLFPAVKHLDIEACQITDSFVSDLLRQRSNNVKSIILRNCPNVPQEIVGWSRARNVDVTVVRQSLKRSANDGRRVRYE